MCSTRQFVRVTKLLLAGVTVFCVSWIAAVNEWHSGVRWSPPQQHSYPTMRTIVAYSEGKQAELDRPTPVTCARLPAYPKIPKIERTWWETAEESVWQHVRGTSVSLFAAYYDARAPQHYIRILAIFHGRNVSALQEMFCQTRSLDKHESSVEVVAAKPLEIWWHDWDKSTSEVDTPLLLSCPIREPLNKSSVVSIVTAPCDDPSNGFRIKPNGNQKYIRTFTVCVKDMDFLNDISHSLTEWIETNKILGAELIDIYIENVNKITVAALLRYQASGFVRLFQVPIKSKTRTLWQRRRDHIITYNDCLYRNIIESRFIIPLDIDEILLPKIAYTWHGLLKRLPYLGWDPYHHSAILVRNVFFFDFMQDLYTDKANSVTRNKKKVYAKRDDVRLKDLSDVIVNKIELITEDTNNSSNEKNSHAIDANAAGNGCSRAIPLPKIARSIISSATISPLGHYSKSFMLTKRVLTAFNHYPLASIGATGFTGWAAPVTEVQLNHYKESCNATIVAECWQYVKHAKVDRSALRLKRRLTRAIANALCQ